MIDGLIIRNYQSHKATRLRFCKGVNVIVGQSDKGKSSILRAFNWARINRPMPPRGSRWGGVVSVEVTLDNGNVVRKKDDGDNVYRVGGKRLTAFGASVPDAVQDLFNMDDINVQGQHNRPFLLDDSPGAVGKKLNEVAGLDIISRALTNIIATANKAEAEKKQGKQYIAELEGDLKQYDDIPAREEDLKALEALAGRLSGVRDREQGVRVLVAQINAVQATIDNYVGLEDMETQLLVLGEKGKELKGLKLNHSNIKNLLMAIKGLDEEINEIGYPTKDRLSALTLIKDKLKNAQQRQDELRGILIDIIKCEKNIDKYDEEYKIADDEYHELMPDICPWCGRGG